MRYYSHTESGEIGDVSWNQVVLPNHTETKGTEAKKIIFREGSEYQGNGKECLERPNPKCARLEETVFSEVRWNRNKKESEGQGHRRLR